MRNYKKLTPFKLCVLQNFPFIEEDFDALTNYELMCKIVEYLNKTIDSQNMVVTNITELNNWFNNLDVQDEINNKLDAMAQSGELAEIIAQYIQLNGVLAYENKNALKNANNIVEGSICKTLGDVNYNDGRGNYYKIRTITSSDVVDDENIIALNISNTLIAEKIKRQSKALILGDSYYDWCPEGLIDFDNRYWVKFFRMNGINNFQGFNKGGIGFYQRVDGVNFEQLLRDNYNNITDKYMIDKIFVFGGYNDAFDNNTTIENINQAIDSFVSYCKQTYPNATVYIGEIGYDVNINSDGTSRRNKINNKVVPAYANTTYNSNNPYIYLSNLEYCLHNKDYMGSDGIHPNTIGHNALANAINCAYNNCFNQLPINEEYYSCTPIDSGNQTVNISLYVRNTIPVKSIRFNNFGISYSGNYPTLSKSSGLSVAKFDTSKSILPVYDIPFTATALIGTTNTGFWVCPVKITFTQSGDLTLNISLLNENRSGWYTIENVNYIEIDNIELTTTMDVL